ncbi:MAG TPA: 16S rRNA (uracil(1498)-N(3))-methyltransferase, partial [Saprospiraceae bacterium]|nr:16S rRNA (uracil(1498)-N(3))-methyltransferase [Saprospiraceae bacterium]
MQLFWGKRINDNVILVEGDEVLHLTKSLRKKVGDAVDLIDGSGNIFHSVITEIQRGKLVAVNMSETPKVNHWKKRLHIAIAPTKNADRMEWFVEKAVEVGID